jgi:DNA-binding NarL/FixJ family response regulator
VADGRPLLLEAIAAAIRLRPELELVASAASAADAVTAIATLRPDVAVLDLPLPGLSRSELFELAGSNGAQTRLVLLCDDVDGDLIFRALAGGAVGFCLRTSTAWPSATPSSPSTTARPCFRRRSSRSWRT